MPGEVGKDHHPGGASDAPVKTVMAQRKRPVGIGRTPSEGVKPGLDSAQTQGTPETQENGEGGDESVLEDLYALLQQAREKVEDPSGQAVEEGVLLLRGIVHECDALLQQASAEKASSKAANGKEGEEITRNVLLHYVYGTALFHLGLEETEEGVSPVEYAYSAMDLLKDGMASLAKYESLTLDKGVTNVVGEVNLPPAELYCMAGKVSLFLLASQADSEEKDNTTDNDENGDEEGAMDASILSAHLNLLSKAATWLQCSLTKEAQHTSNPLPLTTLQTLFTLAEATIECLDSITLCEKVERNEDASQSPCTKVSLFQQLIDLLLPFRPSLSKCLFGGVASSKSETKNIDDQVKSLSWLLEAILGQGHFCLALLLLAERDEGGADEDDSAHPASSIQAQHQRICEVLKGAVGYYGAWFEGLQERLCCEDTTTLATTSVWERALSAGHAFVEYGDALCLDFSPDAYEGDDEGGDDEGEHPGDPYYGQAYKLFALVQHHAGGSLPPHLAEWMDEMRDDFA